MIRVALLGGYYDGKEVKIKEPLPATINFAVLPPVKPQRGPTTENPPYETVTYTLTRRPDGTPIYTLNPDTLT